MWISDARRAQEVDRRSIDEFGLSSVVLMERAGLAVFESVLELMPERGRLGVLCGKGNNGGDAFVVCRLAVQYGFEVECLVTSAEADLRDECRSQMIQAQTEGCKPVFSDDPKWSSRLDRLAQCDVIVDGILGIGATLSVTGAVREAIEACNRTGVPVISIDVPSGIHPDTGEELGESIWAHKTVTMGLPKPFLFQGIGMEHSGSWVVKDIGYPRQLMREPTDTFLLDDAWVRRLLPCRLKSSHKGSNGHVLIVAGSARMRGAAVLAAKGALRSGVGLVTVAAIESVCRAVMVHCPEVLLLPLPENDGVISPEAAALIRKEQKSFDAALFGPGLTHLPQIQELLERSWSDWELPTVVDADALNAVSLGVRLPHVDCLLTPHPGEMSRLMETTTAEIQGDRFGSVRKCVDRYRVSVLLKGAYSIVGGVGESLLVNPTGNAGMASGGMGDVLGGIAASLMAQETSAYLAGGVGMYWHGLAGDMCAEENFEVGFSARDVSVMIPRARAKLTSTCAEPSPSCSSCSGSSSHTAKPRSR